MLMHIIRMSSYLVWNSYAVYHIRSQDLVQLAYELLSFRTHNLQLYVAFSGLGVFSS
jgi:hypothetical protein